MNTSPIAKKLLFQALLVLCNGLLLTDLGCTSKPRKKVETTEAETAATSKDQDTASPSKSQSKTPNPQSAAPAPESTKKSDSSQKAPTSNECIDSTDSDCLGADSDQASSKLKNSGPRSTSAPVGTITSQTANSSAISPPGPSSLTKEVPVDKPTSGHKPLPPLAPVTATKSNFLEDSNYVDPASILLTGLLQYSIPKKGSSPEATALPNQDQVRCRVHVQVNRDMNLAINNTSSDTKATKPDETHLGSTLFFDMSIDGGSNWTHLVTQKTRTPNLAQALRERQKIERTHYVDASKFEKYETELAIPYNEVSWYRLNFQTPTLNVWLDQLASDSLENLRRFEKLLIGLNRKHKIYGQIVRTPEGSFDSHMMVFFYRTKNTISSVQLRTKPDSAIYLPISGATPKKYPVPKFFEPSQEKKVVTNSEAEDSALTFYCFSKESTAQASASK